jgi:hypothetical protein
MSVAAAGHARATAGAEAARVFVNDAGMRVETAGRQALAIILEGRTLTQTLGALRRLTTRTPINTAALRRRLADEAVVRGQYPLM